MTCWILSTALLGIGPEPTPNAGANLFRDRVRSILVEKCLGCHSGDEPKGKLDLSKRALMLKGGESGSAVESGSPESSLLIEKLVAGDMPPKAPLPAESIEAVKSWISAGAPYENEPLVVVRNRAGPDWWSLRPIAKPTPPQVEVSDPTLSRNPIDAFVLAKLKAVGLSPMPEADKPTLIRRLSFDLTGLPPSPEEIDAFVNDASPIAYEKLVDRLLDSPRFGERQARRWLDVVRFGESHGYETNVLRFTAWPYRDYVIRAFNQDVPLPRFILDQIAGDVAPDGDWLVKAATGFLVGGTHDMVGNQTEEGKRQQRMDDLDDMITATASAFLGLTVNCARCHDHKFDPIPQKDYYAIQAVFAGVNHAERDIAVPDAVSRREERERVTAELARTDLELDETEPLADPLPAAPRRGEVNPRRNVERFPAVEARSVRFVILATNDGAEPCLDEIEVFSAEPEPRNVALNASATASSQAFSDSPIHKIIHLNDGRHGNSRSWISGTRGKGWARVDWARPVKVDRIVWGRDRERKYADRLPAEYYIEVETSPGSWRIVASSVDRSSPRQPSLPLPPEVSAKRERLEERSKTLRDRLDSLGESMKVYAGTFSAPEPTHRLQRGDPMRREELVAPAGLGFVPPRLELPADAPDSRRRLEFARWLGRPDNPLPARVMANRLWHDHFGRGIVSSPGDFGFQGGRPTHPELLDYLASSLKESGYRLKPLRRLILTSAAYRRSSRADAKALASDRQNETLWRKSPRRVEAEELRDAILSVGGTLDHRMGGPGYTLWEKNTNYVVVFKPLERLGPETFRRMIYQFKPRSQADPTFGAFDCPDAALVAPRRNVSTTALQALNLLNSRFIVDQSDRFASRIRSEAGDDPARQAVRAFRLAFGRSPSDSERAAAERLIREQGAPTLARVLYNANEFLHIP